MYWYTFAPRTHSMFTRSRSGYVQGSYTHRIAAHMLSGHSVSIAASSTVYRKLMVQQVRW